MKWHYCSIK